MREEYGIHGSFSTWCKKRWHELSLIDRIGVCFWLFTLLWLVCDGLGL